MTMRMTRKKTTEQHVKMVSWTRNSELVCPSSRLVFCSNRNKSGATIMLPTNLNDCWSVLLNNTFSFVVFLRHRRGDDFSNFNNKLSCGGCDDYLNSLRLWPEFSQILCTFSSLPIFSVACNRRYRFLSCHNSSTIIVQVAVDANE